MAIITGYNSNSSNQNNPYQQQLKKTPAFKGTTIETLPDGTKRHLFYLPTKKSTELEIVPVIRDDKTGDYDPVDGSHKFLAQTGQNGFIKLWQPNKSDNKILKIDNPNIKLAYRFVETVGSGKKSEKKPLLDEGRRIKIGGEFFNLAWDPERPNRKKPIAIYTAMPDMQRTGIKDKRDPFNVFGGTINDLRERLPEIQKLGNTHIHSTPLFKNGPNNNHGYWTGNLYQVDPNRGSLKDFKNLQLDLMKRDMGFIADLAAINESWEGIHMKDILKYGSESPFINSFYVHNEGKNDWANPGELDGITLTAPLLPRSKNEDEKGKSHDAWENIGIKLVNAPYKLVYTDGKKNPEIKPNKSYNQYMPAKLQIFDRRRLDKSEQNSNELIDRYDKIKKHDNPCDILDFDDSVQLASFEITQNETELWGILDAAKKHGELNIESLAKSESWGDDFNFKLGTAGTGSNIKTWDGQNDIIKFRFFHTPDEMEDLSKEQRIAAEKGDAMSQDNIVQVGEYWTGWDEKIKTEYNAKNLRENIKKEIEKEIKSQHKNKPLSEKEFNKELNKKLADPEIRRAVLTKMEKDGRIPEGSSKIIKSDYHTYFNKKTRTNEGRYEGAYNLKTAPLPRNITEGLMSLPLEAIEFPDEVCSILTGPHIKKLAAKEDLIGVSRYDLMTSPKFSEDYKNKDFYSKTYKKMDKIYTDKLVKFTTEVIKGSKLLRDKIKIDDNGKLENVQSKEIFRMIADDIVKFAIVKAFSGTEPKNFKKENMVKGEDGKPTYADENLEFDREELAEKTFKTLAENKRLQNSHEAEAGRIIKTIEDGFEKRISDTDETKLRKYLEERVKNLNDDTIKVSKLMYSQKEEGLNWRIDAAKDGADIARIQNEETKPRTKNTFADSWDKNIEFWKRFNTAVRKENPMSYTIAESTDLDKAYLGDDVVPKGKNKGKQLGNYPTLEEVTSKFEEGAGFTSSSNYKDRFSMDCNVALGQAAPFTDSVIHTINKGLFDGYIATPANRTQGQLRSLPIDSALYAHVFSDNQDMSRVLHLMSLVTPKEKYQGMQNVFKKGEKFDWYRKQSKDEQFETVRKNWNQGWVEEQLSGENKEEYRKEKAKLQHETKLNVLAANKLTECYEVAAKKNKMPDKTNKLIKAAINNIANGTYHGNNYARLPQHFGWMSDDKAFDIVLKEAEHLDKINKGSTIKNISKKKWQQVKDAIHQKYTARGRAGVLAIKYYGSLLPGAPAMYNGEEYAQTGLESAGKNQGLHNREAMQPEWLDNAAVNKYNKDLAKINSLKAQTKNRPELSPLVNGHTLRLKEVPEDKNHIYGIYRYNDKTDVIGIINGGKLIEGKDGEFRKETRTIKQLDLSRSNDNGGEPRGIPVKLTKGTVYADAMNPKSKYIINDKGNLVKGKVEGNTVVPANTNIKIDKPALILYRDKTAKNQQKK